MGKLTTNELKVLYCYVDRTESVIESETGFSKEKIVKIEKALLEKGLLVKIEKYNYLDLTSLGEETFNKESIPHS